MKILKILKSISWVICFFAMFSTFITLEAIAATYYVATDGNDTSGDGSIGSPWETFSHADNQMSGGDTLYVRAGTYTEAIEDLPSGTSWENATILKAYNGEPVIIKPSGDNWCFNLTGEYQYIKIEDMAFDAVNVRVGGCMHVKGDRNTSPQKYVHHIRFTNCEAYNSTESNILASYNTHHIEYINCVSHDCGPDPVRDMGFYMAMSDGLVDGCIAYNCSGSGIGVWSVVAGQGNEQNVGSIIRNCKTWNSGEGMGAYSGSDHKIYNNVIWNTTRSGGYGGIRVDGADDTQVYNNTIYDCVSDGIRINDSSGGGQNEPGTNRTIVRNNIIYNVGGSAIDDSGDDTVEDHNLTTDPSFTDTDGADNIAGNADDDLTLQAGSSAIDAGSFVTAPAMDIDGKARPQGAAYDIGAYEYGTGGGDTEGPTAPTDLSATSHSESQIDLTWTASTDNYTVIGYRIYRDNVQIDSSTTTSYSDTGLTENTTHSYTVSAYDAIGNDSGESAASQATTFVDITSPTINSVGISSSSTQVILNFSEPVEEVSATNVLNYSIDNAITVFTASLGSDLKKVTPTTSEHTGGVTYILTVNNIRDTAGIPNVITPDTTVSYTFVAPLISNLTVASGQVYEVVENGLLNGVPVYIDRSYTYSSVPGFLQGATYIKTANDDKESSGDSFLSFDVDKDVIVYVAHDDNITTKPSWLSSFTDTGENLVTTDTTLSIFGCYYLAGMVTLGGNESSGNSMYSVIIVETGGTGVINVAPDGVIDTPTGDMTINEGNTVNFTGYGDDPNGDPLSYLWDFGVGSGIANSTQEDPGPVQFNNPGTYIVTFTVTDSQGLYDLVPDTCTITVQSSNPLVISNLTVASGKNYEIVEYGLQNGVLVYIDRSYTYSSVPGFLQGATYIKTANDDKGSSGDSFLSFDVDQDVMVYVAHDDFTNTKPSWLSSFTDTGENLVTTDTTLSIFESYYLAGTVTLGGNEGGNNSMYSVIIVEQGI